MPYDPKATRTKILQAATQEFAAVGMNGARVDRIAAAADVNKQGIYFHYGSKASLFEAVVEARCAHVLDQVPFDPDDVPGFAGALFDYLTENDDVVRLNTWQQLERPGGADHGKAAYAPLVRALADSADFAELEAAERRARAQDILMLVMALATAWQLSEEVLKKVPRLSRSRRSDLHRQAVVEAAAGLTNRR